MNALRSAAEFVTASRLAHRKLGPLPPELRLADETAAYIANDEASEILSQKFGPVIGYKIGCTTAVMQRYLNIDHPCCGYMFRSSLTPNGAVLAGKDFVRPGVECEIAVTLAQPLLAEDAPFDLTRIRAAIGTLHPAIEIVDERYEDWRSLGAETMIVDDFFHAGIILGPAVDGWQQLDLSAVSGAVKVNGAEIARGHGADLLGNPLNGLVWLANHCAARGKDMAAGTVISLGSFTPVQWLSPGDHTEIVLDGLGALSFSVAV
jgi:2-oxo-3-hexenedioate decarboxylase/2-keto-4-pentenoate hydratase